MLHTKAIAKGRALATMILLAIAVFSSLIFNPLVNVKAIDNNYWNLDFNANVGVYSMPNSETFNVRKAHWKTDGYYIFNNSDCRMDGTFRPVNNIINYTLTIRFYHVQVGDSQQALLRLGTYTNLGVFDKHFITIGILDANTASPILQMIVSTFQSNENLYDTKQLACGFSNNVWHTLVITYNYPNEKIYLYFDNQYWTSEDLSHSGSYIWAVNNPMTLDVGAWRGVYYRDWFCGGIDFISWSSTYTPSYAATQNVLWYHFDDVCPPSTTETESSGNAMHGTLDITKWQTLDTSYSKFGYSIGGSQGPTAAYTCTIPSNHPSISDKFSASIWFYVVSDTWSAAHTITIFHGKTFNFIWRCDGTGGDRSIQLQSNIGGTLRTLESDIKLLAQWTGKWLYIYGKFDGSSLRLSVNSNWTIALTNVSASYSGAITDQSGPYGFWYEGSSLTPARIDEFKLTRNILSPFAMNSTVFGTPEDVTVIVPVSEEFWFKGYFKPDTFYLTQDNPTGTGILMINSSGDFTIRLKDNSLWLLKYFTIEGCNATSWSQPAAVFYTPISFTMKNNTPSATYSGWINVTNSYGIPQPMFFGFTLIVSYGEIINQTMPFDVTVILSPLYLLWDTIKSGTVFISFSSDAPICGVTSERMDISNSKYNGYISIFNENYYAEDLRDNNNFQYFRLKYSVDARILNYGNLTIYHYVRVYVKDNPQTFTIRMITINVNISKTLTLGEKLWVTVTPNSITGKSGEVKQITLRIFSTKIKYVYWTPSQSYDSIRPEYVFCTGDNYLYTNFSVTVSVIIPQACEVARIVTFKVFEVFNPILQNYTTLTVNGIPTGASFSFSLIPIEGYYDTIGRLNIFRGVITTNDLQPDTFFIAQKTNVTAFSTVINSIDGGSGDYKWSLGTNYEIIFNIAITLMRQTNNGDYVIQFTAYTYNTSNYVRKSVILTIGLKKGTTTTTTTTEDNMTSLTGLISIPTVTLNPNVGLNPMIIALVGSTGISYEGIAFAIGLILMFITFIILGKYAKSHLLQMMGSTGMMIFIVMLGLWPMFALILIGIIGAALLSWRIFGK